MKNSNDLVQHINVAFEKGQPPATPVENMGGGFEPELVYKIFHNKTWPEISWNDLKNHPKMDTTAPFYFLNSDAFIYYLPAFMRICLQQEPKDDLDLFPDKLIWALDPSTDFFLTKFDSLALPKKKTIALFLNFFANPPVSNADAVRYLKMYWNQFL